MLGTTVGGGLVGTVTFTVGVGGKSAGGDGDIGVDAQAAMKTAAKMNAII
jgi:hypothetical protein